MRRALFIVTGVLGLSAAVVALPNVFASSSGSSRRTSNVARPPVITAVEYGRFRPKGADRSYTAIRLKGRDPNGQIVSVASDTPGFIADGGCGLGGKRTGEATTLTLPVRLSPGRHRLHLTADSSSCDSRNIIESTTSTFRLTVRK